MIRYRRLSLKNVVYYKTAELDLDHKGLTVIMGLNRNATGRDRRNGTGKSLLLTPLHHLKYANPSAKTPRTDKHQLFAANSSMRLDLAVDGVDWSLTKATTAKKQVRWRVLKDGKDTKPRTATVAESMVADLLPLTEEQFYSTVYLDSRRPFTILYGTPTERQAYLSGMFDLGDFEGVRRYFMDKARELAKLQNESSVYQTTLADFKWVEDYDQAEAKRRAAKLRAQTRQLSERHDTTVKQLADRELWEEHHVSLELAYEYDDEAYEQALETEREWTAYLAKVEATEGQQERLRQFRRDAKLARKLLPQLANTPDPDLRQAVSEWLAKARSRQARYEVEVQAWEDSRAELDELEDQRANAVKLKKEATKPDGNLVRKLRAKVDALTERIRHLLRHDTSECPYCGAPLDEPTAKAKADESKVERKRVKNDLDELEEQERLYQNAMVEWPKHNERRYKQLQAMDKPAPEPVEFELIDRLGKLELAFEEPVDLATKPTVPRNQARQTLAKQIKCRNAYLTTKNIRADIERGATVPSTDKLLERRDKLQRALEAANRKQLEAATDAKRYNSDLARWKKTTDRIQAIERKTKDKKIVDVLVDAYGNKGVKLLVLRSICANIEANLNEFAALLFPEAFRFSIEVDVNTLNVLVDRGNNIVSDVRYLSGAESRMFSLLWLLSVLPMMPERSRSNLVVLDEFEAGIDRTTRRMLFDEYLPQLNQVVEHIVFVTPNEITPKSNRRVLVAVKDGDTTQLREHTGTIR